MPDFFEYLQKQPFAHKTVCQNDMHDRNKPGQEKLKPISGLAVFRIIYNYGKISSAVNVLLQQILLEFLTMLGNKREENTTICQKISCTT